MGLFSRPTVPSPSGGHSFVDVIQNEGNNTGRGLIAWRHPSSDFNTHSKYLSAKEKRPFLKTEPASGRSFPVGRNAN